MSFPKWPRQSKLLIRLNSFSVWVSDWVCPVSSHVAYRKGFSIVKSSLRVSSLNTVTQINLFTLITLCLCDIRIMNSRVMTKLKIALESVKRANSSTVCEVRKAQQMQRVGGWHGRCFTIWQIRSFGGQK